MTCDVEKLSRLRTRLCLTQEALAGRAHVSPRTIQRAEAGEPISLNNVQEIASALGVMASELLVQAPLEDGLVEPDTIDEAKTIAVTLRPRTTARALLDAIGDCLNTDLQCVADVRDEICPVVIAFLECLKSVLPDFPNDLTAPNADNRSADPAERLIEQIRCETQINQQLKSLREVGIEVYAGAYLDVRSMPTWDDFEGRWAWKTNSTPEDVKVAVVRLAPSHQRQLIVRLKKPMPL